MKHDWPTGSYDEWSPLREVVVGCVEGAHFPSWDRILRRTIPEEALVEYEQMFEMSGEPVPPDVVELAKEELSVFIDLLKSLGIVVHRPDSVSTGVGYSTPDWRVESGVSAANPRDIILVAGDTIIECPTADRGRYFEMFAYRTILRDMEARGFRWISAPKPRLDEPSYGCPGDRFAVTENEILFDAADFVRCGDFIVGQLSHVTNRRGFDWLRRTLGSSFDVRMITSRCSGALHIDTTICPLEEGVVLVNPEFVESVDVERAFPGWRQISAPRPASFYTEVAGYRVVSDWMSLNLLSLGNRRVVIESKQTSLARVLAAAGFEVELCDFDSYYIFGGSFHCATLDLVRNG
ncbi:MAG: amidinotransferase [Acidimicrobiia bacterium]|jgi:glycine amidinotransferase|nr:amidinotransferase [Acidimicrobiia bacterium]